MRERDFMEEFHLEAINQNEKHEERAPLRGKMTHMRENYQCLLSNSLFFSQRSWSSQNCIETQQTWSDLWSRPSHPWTRKEDLESTDKETGLAKFCSKTISYQHLLPRPLFLSWERMENSEQVAWIQGRKQRWFHLKVTSSWIILFIAMSLENDF